MGFSFPIHGGNGPPQPRGLLWGSNHELQVCSLLCHSKGLWVQPELPHFSQRGSPFAPLPLPPPGPLIPRALNPLSPPGSFPPHPPAALPISRSSPAPARGLSPRPPILSPMSLPADTHGVSELLQGHVHPGHPA